MKKKEIKTLTKNKNKNLVLNNKLNLHSDKN